MTAAGEHESFLTAIQDSPDDDSRRLVYADWLEEQADPRAEYLRLSIKADPSQQERRRMAELGLTLEPAWLAKVTRRPIDLCRLEVEMEFACPLHWEDLEQTDRDLIRHCHTCDSKVYFCSTRKEAIRQAQRKNCVCYCPTTTDISKDELRSHYGPVTLMRGMMRIDPNDRPTPPNHPAD